MKKYGHYAVLTIACLVGGMAGAAEVSPMPVATGGNSSLPRLVTGTDGSVYLSWVSRRGAMSSLSWSKLADGVWQPPQLVSQGDDWFINWADFPSLAVNDDTMAAHWLQLNPEGFYNYDVKAAFYHAGSRSWGEAITVNRDGVSAEHGFVSMLPLSEGKTFMAWLDGRYTRGNAGAGSGEVDDEGHGIDDAMSLHAGIFDRGGNVLDDWELDKQVCDCCQTDAALAESGPVVVYRDRSDHEIRDIYFTRLTDGRWSEPAAVHHDNWQIEGCPVNGPAVTAEGRRVAVVWFCAKDGLPEVKLALSGDSGASFSAPVIVAHESPIGRVGAAWLNSGKIALTWVDAQEETARLMLALYDAGGDLLDSVRITDISPSPLSGFPVIASSNNDAYVAWTDVSEEPRVKVVKVRFQ